MTTHVAVTVPGLYDRVALDDGAVLPLPDPGAVLLRHGDEVALDYADLDALAEYAGKGQGDPPAECRVEGKIEWQTPDGVRGEAPIHMRAAIGCRAYARVNGAVGWALLPREQWADFADFVLDGMGLIEATDHTYWLEGRWSEADLGEVVSQSCPLSGDPDASGSEFVSAYGCPQILAMALTGQMTVSQSLAAHEEARRRAGRAVWWRDADGLLLGRQTEYLMHRGYRAESGGWEKAGSGGKPLYGAKVPPGVPGKTGGAPGHPTHGELELAIGLAVMTGSMHLAEAAWGTWQIWVRLYVAGDFQSSRSIGRTLRTAALLSFLPGVDMETLAGDVAHVLAYQHARSRAGMPSPDWEGVSSYHINLSQIDACLTALGIDPDTIPVETRRKWGDSDSCWMVAQARHGAVSVRRSPLYAALGAQAMGRLEALEDACTGFLYAAARETYLDIGAAVLKPAGGVTGTYEDLALDGPVKLAKGGQGQGDALGVLARFWAPEIYQLAHEQPWREALWREIAEPVMAVCDAERRWGSRDADDLLRAVLESQWPVVRLRGLPG